MFGGPSFMARLLPICTIKLDIHTVPANRTNCNSFVYLVLCANLWANQKTIKLFHDKYGSEYIFGVTHPVPTPAFAKLYLFFDLNHLFKNIWNNWVMEKMKTLDFIKPFKKKNGRTLSKFLIKKLLRFSKKQNSYSALYPKKTIVPLNDKLEIKVLVENVTNMWHILNVKIYMLIIEGHCLIKWSLNISIRNCKLF